MTQEPRRNIVRVVMWSAVIVIALGVLLSIAAGAQDAPPISEAHCCRVWLPLIQKPCGEDWECPAPLRWEVTP